MKTAFITKHDYGTMNIEKNKKIIYYAIAPTVFNGIAQTDGSEME